jgi:hypothetical protein
MITSPPSGVTVINGCPGCNYGLGVLVRPVGADTLSPIVPYNTWHFGHWPTSTVTTPREFGAFAARWTTNGFTVVVIYDRGVSDAARTALDTSLFNAAGTPDP